MSSDGKPKLRAPSTDPSKEHSAQEIDSEDEAWDGALELSAFQQVRDAQKKAQIVAKLEAMNRRGSAAQSGGTSSAACTGVPPGESASGK
mmetsp:Transcript_46712/g.137972  ORF Transcript_46712/g.137972 Transcript_46712/m.137972 type:complete len:90 (+) Transcript_46712:101-370(+)